MRVGVVSDVHANRVALDAVLADLPDVDALVCAGDVVGYYPWPAQCVEAMREGAALQAAEIRATESRARDVPTVMGNHDRMVVSGDNFGANAMARAGVDYARERLTDDQLAWLRDLPRERALFDGRLKVVHDHPTRRDHYTYPEEFGPDLLGDEDALVLGHTHVQHHATYDEGVVLNPGSVGQPRDGDPRAAYAVLDLDSLAVEERRVEYDIDAVAEAVQEAGLPRRTADRLYEGQ